MSSDVPAAVILDVIDDPDWTQCFGNAFAKPI
jgi:hypothetical protein